MIYAILTAILVALALQTIVFVAVFKRFGRTVEETRAQVQALVSPGEDGGPSPLAQVAKGLVDQGAKSVVDHIKTSFMGIESGQARAEKFLDGAISSDALALGAPGLAQVLGNFPTVKKFLMKNPALADLAIQKLANFGSKVAGPQGGPTNGQSNPGQGAFEI